MNKKVFSILGIGAIALAFLLNVSYAVDNYGILKSNLSLQVYASSSSQGGGGGGGTTTSGSSGEGYEEPKKGSCDKSLSGKLYVSYKILGQSYLIPINFTVEIKHPNVEISCKKGGQWECKTYTCGDFWKDQQFSTVPR